MKKIFLILILFISAPSLLSQINAITEDGKKVILKSDGTWEYIQEEASDTKISLGLYGDNYEINLAVQYTSKKLEYLEEELEQKKIDSEF